MPWPTNAIIWLHSDPISFEQAREAMRLAGGGDSGAAQGDGAEAPGARSIALSKFLDASDTNGSGSLDGGDSFASDPKALALVRAVVTKYAPGIRSSSAALSPEDGHTHGQIVGTPIQLFGEFPANRGRYANVVQIGPPKDSGNDAATAEISFADGCRQQVTFAEHRSGIARILSGQSVEEQYVELVDRVSAAYGYDDERAFFALKAHASALQDDRRQSAFARLSVGAIGLGALGASSFLQVLAATQAAAGNAMAYRIFSTGRVLYLSAWVFGLLGLAFAGYDIWASRREKNPWGPISETIASLAEAPDYESFKATLDEYPILRAPLKLLWWSALEWPRDDAGAPPVAQRAQGE